MKVKFNLPIQRYNSKITFDNNTTLGVGNLQPLFCKFVVPKSKFNCNLAQLTRLSPLVVPSSSDYTIGDLLAAGLKVAPVSTDILHDEAAVNSLPSLDASSSVDSSNV